LATSGVLTAQFTALLVIGCNLLLGNKQLFIAACVTQGAIHRSFVVVAHIVVQRASSDVDELREYCRQRILKYGLSILVACVFEDAMVINLMKSCSHDKENSDRWHIIACRRQYFLN
jgi:hypothetical protein